MKTKFTILLIILILAIYLFSPWTPAIRKPPPTEISIVSILAERKEFADQIIQEYSPLPKNSTQEIRDIYKEAQLKFNTIIEIFGYGADNSSIPIDIISKKLSDAEKAYGKLLNYIEALKNKPKKDRILYDIDQSIGISQMRKYSAFSQGEVGELLRAFNEIAGQRDIYDRIAKRIGKYRWDTFPEK